MKLREFTTCIAGAITLFLGTLHCIANNETMLITCLFLLLCLLATFGVGYGVAKLIFKREDMQ